MEIDFVQKKEPAIDVVTVKCKIKHLMILAGTVDLGANFLIMSEDISKRSKLEIDTKEKYDLRGIATTPTKSLGIVRNVSVNFAPGYTIYADFAIVKYPKPMLILPNTLLNKYNYDLLASWWYLDFGQSFSRLAGFKQEWYIKKKVSYKEFEKMLYSTLKYNAEINEYCERLQTCYNELLRK